MLLPTTAHLRVGTAGWSIPRASAARFDSEGTHLVRYATHFNCVEINSSFHHERKLLNARQLLVDFLRQTEALGEKRGPLLVQLPPSLAFDENQARTFFDLTREQYEGPLVCEPRHPTWFSAPVASLLDRYRVARVVADPPPAPEATVPAGFSGLVYFRLHGSPQTYWSKYDEPELAAIEAQIRTLSNGCDLWCVFDNTASGAAIENAWALRGRLERPLG